MAVSLLRKDVSDLCLGKPPLRYLPVTDTVADALSALKSSGDGHVSVWSYSESGGDCKCVGKVSMVDVICFLCKDENVIRPSDVLHFPISDILPKAPAIVRHLEHNSSLLEAIDYILEGTQNLILPIQSHNSRKKVLKKPSSFCWLTQEDVVRYLLNSIGVFSPIPTFTIESLNMIDTDVMTVHYDSPASAALALISRSHIEQTAVAVIDEDKRLIGEISPLTLASCDETVAAAIITLSAGDLLSYIDCCGPSGDLMQAVKTKLQEKNLAGMLELIEEYLISSSSSCSSDEELGSGSFSGSVRGSPARSSEAIMCYPWSSLMAVMIQALTHRVNCVWVVKEDYTLVGNVTLAGMLKVFRSIAAPRHKAEGEINSKQ